MNAEEKILMFNAIGELKGLESNGDSESTHTAADAVLVNLLDDLGFKNVTKAYEDLQEKVTFWYA